MEEGNNFEFRRGAFSGTKGNPTTPGPTVDSEGGGGAGGATDHNEQ